MSPANPAQADYIPRRYHEQQITALTDRSIQAEEMLANLLRFIDPDIMERNGFDWLRAVQELIPPPATAKDTKGPKKGTPAKVSP